MKHWIYLSVFALFLGLMPQEAQAQGFLKRARERAEKKLKQRADKAVDKTVDKSLDNAEDAVTGKKKKKKSSSKTTDKSSNAKKRSTNAAASSSAASSKRKKELDSRLSSAEEVMDAYFNALGGQAKLEKLNNIYIKASASMAGRELGEERIMLQGQKYRTLTTMSGNEIPETFDGKQHFSDGKVSALDAENLKKQQLLATYPAELAMQKQGYSFEFLGIDNVQGKKCYKVRSENAEKTENYQLFFDMETGLKVQQIHNYMQATPGTKGVNRQQVAVYSNYKEVEGVQVPYTEKRALRGYEIKYNVEAVQFNIDLPAETFEIEN